MLLTVGLFIILIISVFYLPGRFFLRVTSYKNEHFSIILALSLGIGICSFLFITYLLSWFKLELLVNVFIVLLIVLEAKKSFHELLHELAVKRLFSIETALIFLGTIAMTYISWRSGVDTNGNYIFYGVHAVDSIYHQSLIGNLMYHFPPTNPGLAGVSLHGYNFFYDFLIANFSKFYHINRYDLFFKYFAFFTSLLFGLSALALARVLKMKRVVTCTFLYLLFFAQSFKFLSTFLPNNFGINLNFEVVQSFANILSPSVVLSISLFFLLFVSLFTIKNKIQLFIPAIIIGILPEIKIYTAFIAFISLVVLGSITLLKSRNINYILILLIGGIIAAIVYLPINFGAGNLIFAPFLLYRHYMDSTPFFTKMFWPVTYEIYLEHKNIPRLVFMNLVVATMYLIPNLGLRIAGILALPKLLKSRFYITENIFLLVAILTAFIIPTLFIQSIFAFVIFQFLWVGYIILIIPTSYVLSSFLKGRSLRRLLIYIFILAIFTVPDSYILLKGYSSNPIQIDANLIMQAKEIESHLSPDDQLLVLNRSDKKNIYIPPLISSLTSRSVYYEPTVTEFMNTDQIIRERKDVVDKIISLTETCKNLDKVNIQLTEIMRRTNNKYIFSLHNNLCIGRLDNFKIISKSGPYILYKMKQ